MVTTVFEEKQIVTFAIRSLMVEILILLWFLIPRPLAAGSFRLIWVQGLPWGLIPFIKFVVCIWV
jgi:hypothetical protein